MTNDFGGDHFDMQRAYNASFGRCEEDDGMDELIKALEQVSALRNAIDEILSVMEDDGQEHSRAYEIAQRMVRGGK